MALTEHESLLVEAVKRELQGRLELGLPKPDLKAENDNNPRLRGPEYIHYSINELFASKITELVHFDSARAAFAKVHSYRDVDDPIFTEATERELVAMGVPKHERQKVQEAISNVVKELKEEYDVEAERDFGYHPDLDEIRRVSQPPQYDA